MTPGIVPGPRLYDAIGVTYARHADAEEMAYFYASCDRKASYRSLADEDGLFVDRFTGTQFIPGVQQRRDFAELTAANAQITQFGCRYFVPAMQRATPGILTLPSSS